MSLLSHTLTCKWNSDQHTHAHCISIKNEPIAIHYFVIVMKTVTTIQKIFWGNNFSLNLILRIRIGAGIDMKLNFIDQD